MRWILIVALLVFGAAATACLLPASQQTPAGRLKPEWVRTRDGWESWTGWGTPSAPYQPALHPTVVATGEIFISLIALVACSRDPCPSRPRRPNVRTASPTAWNRRGVPRNPAANRSK